jgi:hypothetical protein
MEPLAQSPSTAAPLIAPGDHVLFGCTGGQILLNGSLVCDNGAVSLDIRGSAFCEYSVVGKNLNPQAQQFTGWQSNGDANVTNPFSLNATLILHAPNPTVQYAGEVNLSLRTPSQIHLVDITIHSFVNWITAADFANVTICSSPTYCPFTNLRNGATVNLQSNTTYEFNGYPSSGYHVKQWTTNSGSIANSTLSTAQIYVQTSGIVSLIVQGEGLGAGYFNAPPMSSQTIFSASADIIVPHLNNSNYDDDSVWVGIGGFGISSSLWQAGFEVANGNIVAFWEAKPANSSGSIVPNSTMTIVPGNVLLVSVSTFGGTSNATVTNLNTSEVWKISDKFTPSTVSADWIVEPKSIAPFGLGQTVLFESLNVNQAPPSLEGCFVAAFSTVGSHHVLLPTLLNEGVGDEVYFSVI